MTRIALVSLTLAITAVGFSVARRSLAQSQRDPAAPQPVTDRLRDGAAALTPLVDRYRAAGVRAVTHDFYPGGRHEMLNETNRDEVVRNLLGFVMRFAR